MAVVTTTIVPSLTFFPWTDEGGQSPDTIQPIGEIMANSLEEDVTLSGTGDTQEIRWNITLPVNYSYVLQDLAIMLESTAMTWNDNQTLIFLDLVDGPVPAFRYGVGLLSQAGASGRGPGTTSSIKTWRPTAYPKFQQGGAGVWQSTLVNLTTEEPAAVLNATARFLQYTIGQRYDAGINTPQLIR